MILARLKKVAFPIVSRYTTRATLVEGVQRISGLPLRCLAVDDTRFTARLFERIYSQPPEVRSSRRIRYSVLPNLLQNPPDDPDLVIAAMPHDKKTPLESVCDFKGQQFVHQILHILPGEQGARRLHKSLGNALRRIRKAGFSYRISTSVSDFDFFFHRMYLPHAARQFGQFSDASDYDDLKQYFQRGFLLLLFQGERSVAGEIDFIEGNELVNHRLGVLDGSDDLIQKGAQAALYCFRYQMALDRGYSSIDLQTSLAQFADGVYQHKRLWGATAYPDSHPRLWFFLRILRYSASVISLFRNHPMIILGPNGLSGLIGYDGPAPPGEAVIEQWRSAYQDPGIPNFFVLTPGASAPMEFHFNKSPQAEGLVPVALPASGKISGRPEMDAP